MTMEAQIFEALRALVSDRVIPDFADEGETLPFITYQAVGGAPVNYIEGAIPNRENTRLQVNVWAATRDDASALGKQVEDALRLTAALQTEVITGRIATYDEDTKYRGTMQDFSIWT
jgi:hypothetical protein